MRLSVSTWLLNDMANTDGPEGMKKAIDVLHGAGFDTVDPNLWMLSGHGQPISRDNWREWAEEVRAYADRVGVRFAQSHGQTLSSLKWDDPDYADADFVWQMNYRCIEVSRILGVEWMVMHPSNLPHDPLYSSKKAKEANLTYLAPFIEAAKKAGIGIAVENLVDFGRHRRRYCGGDPYELLDLVDTINDPSVGVCIDIGHANNGGVNAGEFIRLAGNRLKCTHVNDNLGTDDAHLPPFFGSVDWNNVMSALRDAGYSGDFSFEINPRAFPDPLSPVFARFLFNLGTELLRA